MQNIEKLASASYIVKQANAGKIKYILKALGLAGTSGLAGGLLGEQVGFDRGMNTAGAINNQDMAKGIAMLLQEIAQKGKGV
jgi:hypothetical protein